MWPASTTSSVASMAPSTRVRTGAVSIQDSPCRDCTRTTCEATNGSMVSCAFSSRLLPSPPISFLVVLLGNCHISEDIADELTVEFAKSHWVVFSDPDNERKSACGVPEPDHKRAKYYSSTPPATRGIPHNFIPRIHSALNPYCDFIETTRKISGRDDSDTVDSIMCLPFSAWSQACIPPSRPLPRSSHPPPTPSHPLGKCAK